MERKKYEWFKSIVEAIKTAKIEFEDLDIYDYVGSKFKVSITMKKK